MLRRPSWCHYACWAAPNAGFSYARMVACFQGWDVADIGLMCPWRVLHATPLIVGTLLVGDILTLMESEREARRLR
jgi:Ribosomal protein S28e